MIKLIKNYLDEKKVQYVITERVESSYELFFVRHDLQMNRAKDVKHYNVTVYHTHDKFMGNASTAISPSMNEKEVKEELDNLIYAASLVNNIPFKLAKPVKLPSLSTKSNLKGKDKIKIATKIAETIFKADNETNGIINATEIFVNDLDVRVVNSNGIDYSKSSTIGQVEYITTWIGEKEEVELYRWLEFANLDLKALKEDVKEKLKEAHLRSVAKPMPSFKKIDVVFRPMEIKEMLGYYLEQTNFGTLFSHQSNLKLNDKIQKNIKGDKLNISIDPFMVSSLESSSFDNMGFKNSKVKVINNGIVKEFWGSSQFAQYLKSKSRTNSFNMLVNKGSLDLNKEKKYLEIISMSGIQVDGTTGSFGGEIRLAILHEGSKTTPYTGGSITGFMNNYINSVKLSKEVCEDNNYNGPKYMMFKGCPILGK